MHSGSVLADVLAAQRSTDRLMLLSTMGSPDGHLHFYLWKVVWLAAVFGASAGMISCGSGGGSNSFLSPSPIAPPSSSSLQKLSTDVLTNTVSQHATEVEPHALAFGSRIVAAFQVGRNFQGGAAAIGFATSVDGGATWSSGMLSGLTVFVQNAPYIAATDPNVAYDVAHA